MSKAGSSHAGARRSVKLRVAAALLVWPVGLALLRGLAMVPDLVERWYSNGVYVGVRAVQPAVAGLLPISLSELLIVLLLAWLASRLLSSWRRWRAGEVRAGEVALTAGRRGLYAAGALWVAFLVLWGLQHARRPYAWHARLDQQPVTVDELRDLSFWLVFECNRWGARASLDDFEFRGTSGGVDERILTAYERLADDVPALRGGKPLLRRPLSSPILSRLGISGIYSPFTGEAHLNSQVRPWIQPFSACHELAHQKGFAREDEANFIAWQVCRASEDPALKYSASFVAMTHSLAALERVRPFEAEILLGMLDESVLSDLDSNRSFWRSKHSVVTEVSTKVNDTYLKSAGSSAGVRSYGRMVDLLVAERRTVRGG